jgi:hypothetical protein
MIDFLSLALHRRQAPAATAPARRARALRLTLLLSTALWSAGAAAQAERASAALGNFPTSVRVEYVQECINLNGGAFALLYQCSCALDRLAEKYTVDDFIEAATFVKYATLGGERGGEFRDPEHARDLARKFRSEQSAAYKACNVRSESRAR